MVSPVATPQTPSTKYESSSSSFSIVNDKVKENISGLFLAEYSAQQGRSIITHQYPPDLAHVSKDNISLIAQQMIPEGVERRNEDWSIFFLNRDSNEPQKQEQTQEVKQGNESVQMDGTFVNDGSSIFEAVVHTVNEETHAWYTIDEHGNYSHVQFQRNTVNNEVIGRIIVRGTKGDIIAIYNLADDLEYTVLSENYNDMGLKFISLYSIENELIGLLIDSETELALGDWIQEAIDLLDQNDNTVAEKQKPFLYCMNFVRSKEDTKGIPGESLKAIALCSAHAHFFTFRALLRRGMDLIMEEKKDPETVIQEIYTIICAVDLTDVSELSEMQRKVWRYSIGDSETLRHKTSVMFRQRKYNISIPLAVDQDEIGDERISLTKLIQKFKMNTMDILNAVLEKKRIVFLGSNIPVGDLCCYVLSVCQLVCPPLKGLLKRSVFPYQSLDEENMVFGSIKGSIAGVVNPIFKTRTDLWDVLCDLSDGSVVYNPDNRGPSVNVQMGAQNLYKQVDLEFVEQILALINSHALKGVNPSYSEDAVRSHFQEYTRRILNMAAGQAIFQDEETKKTIEFMNMHRIKLILQSDTCTEYLQQSIVAKSQSSIRGYNAENAITKLRVCRNLPEEEIVSIFHSLLKYVKSEEQLYELLSYLPEAQGGLYPIAVVLLHPSPTVRKSVVTLLQRIDKLREGACCISQLNTFLLLTFDRYSREMQYNNN